MRLEDLRGPHIGDTALVLPDGGTISAAFHDHASQAQWHTINCLMRVAGQQVDGVADERIAVVEWWRTVESLVALAHLVAMHESDTGLRGELPRVTTSQRDGALERWSGIARWFSEARDSAPKATTGRVRELRDFRNSFEHTSRENAIEVRFSRLATIPASANLADAMEAMAICAEAAGVLRHVIRGADLMPQCIVPSAHHLFYIPLETLAAELLFPQYERVVAALGLTTDVVPYPTPGVLRGESLVAPRVAIKAHPGPEDMLLSDTFDLWPEFETFAETRPELPLSNQGRLPDYVRSP